MVFRTVGSAIYQVATHLGASIAANLIAIAFCVPLLVVIVAVAYATRSLSLVPLGVMVLMGVLPNPAMAGVQSITRELAHGEFLTFGDYSTGLREYWRPALKAWLLALLVTGIILANLAFYASQASHGNGPFHAVAGPAEFIWAYLLLSWLALHLYVFPLLIEQEDKRLVTTYRNAVVLAGGRPIFTMLVAVIWFFLLGLAAATGLATFIGLTLGAAIQQNAVARLIPTFARGRSS